MSDVIVVCVCEFSQRLLYVVSHCVYSMRFNVDDGQTVQAAAGFVQYTHLLTFLMYVWHAAMPVSTVW